MGTWVEYLNKDRELAERLIIHAFSRNPNISSFNDFQDALLSPDPKDNRIKRLYPILDDFAIKDLWENESCKARLRQNLNEEQFINAYAVSTQKQVIREKSYGKKTKKEEIMAITIPRGFKVHSHFRKNRPIKTYLKTYMKWTDEQIKFLLEKKMAKKITIKQIIYLYNQKYKDNQRTASSITTKLYRL